MVGKVVDVTGVGEAGSAVDSVVGRVADRLLVVADV